MTHGLRWAPLHVLMIGGLLLAAGCQDSSLPSRTRLDDPQALTFQCLAPGGGVPVSGCGCIVPDPEGAILTEEGPLQTGYRSLGRVACTCQTIEVVPAEDPNDEAERFLRNVDFVEVNPDECQPVNDERGCQVDWDCTPITDPETGDWIPADRTPEGAGTPANGCPDVPPRPQTIRCASDGGGELRTYVSAARRGEVALIDLSDDSAIEDVDRTIPGNTSIFVDDVISDIGTHPRGRFVFTVNSTTASLTVITEDRLLPSHTVSLGLTTPILEALVTPSPTAMPTEEWWRAPALAFISAPHEGQVLVVDLDALADPEATADSVIIDTLVLDDADALPGRLAADEAGLYLFVAHLESSSITVVDRTDFSRQVTVQLAPGECNDGYLTSVITDLAEAALCADGLDNDGDGTIDADDPECAQGLGWEGVPAALAGEPSRAQCPQRYECFDNVDNDGDGLVDAIDDDCTEAVRWERPTPACADGLDNDGDGLVDVADPDCRNEADTTEEGREVSTCADGIDNDADGQVDEDCDVPPECNIALTETPPEGCPPTPLSLPEEVAEGAPCRDGIDNDGDGLTDSEDPGCRDFDAPRRFGIERIPECANGVDDDGDGLIDFAPDGSADPDCYAASDDNEGGQAVRLGPTALTAPVVVVDGERRHFLYALDRTTGDPHRVELPGDPAALLDGPLSVRRLRFGLDLQQMVARQIPGESDALLTLDGGGVLRSVEISDRTPLVDQSGRPIYARLENYQRRTDDFTLNGQYYVLEDGVAYCVSYCNEQVFREGAENSCPTVDDLESCTTASGEAHPLFTMAVDSRALPLSPESFQLEVTLSDADRQALTSLVPANGALGVTVSLLDPDNADADRDRGFRDPLMILGGTRRLLEDLANVSTTAQGMSNLVSTVPTLRVEETAIRYERQRHPTFCRPDPTLDAAEPVTSADRDLASLLANGPCTPVGFESDGTEEALQSSRDRTQFSVDVYEGIQVLEENPRRVPSDDFTLAYEGELPRTESRSGQYGPPYFSALDPATAEAETWTLLDYQVDLCDRGIQVNDVVLVDQMVPADDAAAEIPVCANLYAQLSAEPLRYRVVEVGEHRMVLQPDPRTDYLPQVPRDDRSSVQTLDAVTQVPPFECAAQFIQYRVRVADDQWLLTGARSGYRHSIVNLGGECVADEERLAAGRHGRTYLGDVFENEWFRFRLGYLGAGDDVISGVPTSRLPHMVETSFTFTTRAGRSTRSASVIVGLAQEMSWLPLDDHLYIVDSAVGSVVEVVDLDIYTEIFRALQTFD
ncbi:MAG: hypothetical protein ACE366_01155 [Bradymonadia bacterium]